jgi:hypothetical protein
VHRKDSDSELLKSHNSPSKAIELQASPDRRLERLRQWIAAQLAGNEFGLAPASADASFRRYFRVSAGARSWIAMDAPPEHEDCGPFVRVAGLLRAAGVNAPRIDAQDLAQGFLLLTDFGDTTFLAALDESNAGALFGDAIDALIRWQLASRAGELPPYDEALLRRECALYPEWYVARHLGATLTEAQRGTLEEMTGLIIARALAQPRVYVHRDYMPRNLMLTDPHLRRGLAHARRVRELGGGARHRLVRALLGEGSARGAAGRRGLRRFLPRLRVDGAAAPPEGDGHLRAHPFPSATASRATSRTRRASCATRARSRSATASSRRSRA